MRGELQAEWAYCEDPVYTLSVFCAQILKGLEEHAFPQTPRYTDTFNDTSVHWFPVRKLTQLSADTWAFREEPDYQGCEDLEIIRNAAQGPSATDSNSL